MTWAPEATDALAREVARLLGDGSVCEVDFVPADQPPFVLVEGGALGIAMPALKPLYAHAYTRLLQALSALKSNCCDENLRDVLTYSSAALAVKGDLIVAYCARKTLLVAQPHRLHHEVAFLRAIFSKHPKSPAGWEHRRWCLRQLHHRHLVQRQGMLLSASEVETEKELCRAMAEKFPKNYYAWMHRLWLLPHMTPFQLEDEVFFLTAWLRSHISDHSAVQHFLQVVHRIATSGPALAHMLEVTNPEQALQHSERYWNQLLLDTARLVEDRPGHDSLWCLRRGLFVAMQQAELVRPLAPEAAHEALTTLLHDLHCADGGEGPPLPMDELWATGCNPLSAEIEFVRRQVHIARWASCPIWDPQRHIAAALRSLLFMLSRCATVGAVGRWGSAYRQLVEYLAAHGGGCSLEAYLRCLSS